MENKIKKKIIPEGILVAYVTVLGYALAFIYEYAHAEYFGISYLFLSVEIWTIFVAITFVAAFLFFIKVVFDLLQDFGILKETAIGRFRSGYIGMFLFGSPSIFAAIQRGDYFLIYVLPAVLFLAVISEISMTYFYGRGVKTWKKKREKLEMALVNTEIRKEEESVSSRIFRNIFGSFQESISIPVLLASLFLCLTAFSLGGLSASSGKKFYVLNTDPERFVVTRYNDFLLTLPLDRDNFRFGDELKFVKIESFASEGLFLSLQNVGPLKRSFKK